MERFFNSGGRAAVTYTVLFWAVNLPLCVLDLEDFTIRSMIIIPLVFGILYTIFERKYNKEKFKIYNLSFFATTLVFAVVIFNLFYEGGAELLASIHEEYYGNSMFSGLARNFEPLNYFFLNIFYFLGALWSLLLRGLYFWTK